MHVALISLEPWDDVWRRNQHLVAQLVEQGLVGRLTYVEPTSRRPRHHDVTRPVDGVDVVVPRLALPKRAGGLRLAGRTLRAVLAGADVVWVNDPAFGLRCLTPGQPAVYDVTDDWRTFSFPPRIVRRITRAEDALATRASTVVCSAVLQARWRDRYGIEAPVVRNGVDVGAWARAEPLTLTGPGPHVGYVGTLHPHRLDLGLVLRVADRPEVGTLHLVGPDALDGPSRALLDAHPKISRTGPVPATAVPGWITAMDVLISPHLVNDFTLSLDAIKSYEYLASGRPVVATPTSGFQELTDAVVLAAPDGFPAQVGRAAADATLGRLTPSTPPVEISWAHRAREFGRILQRAATARSAAVPVGQRTSR